MKSAMSVVAFPCRMLGAHSRGRPLPLSLVGWCESGNNINDHNCTSILVNYKMPKLVMVQCISWRHDCVSQT